MKLRIFALGTVLVTMVLFLYCQNMSAEDQPTNAISQDIEAALESYTAVPGRDNVSKPIVRPVRENPVENVWAVLIGFSIFENDPVHLPEFSSQDVEQMAISLKELGVPDENIVCMTMKRKEFYLTPTRENILAMLRLMVNRAGKNDTIWVMFSGIGVALDGTDCFLPKGTNLGSANGWIRVSEVKQILSQSKAKKTAVLWLANRKNAKHLSAQHSTQPLQEPRQGENPDISGNSRQGKVLFSCSAGTFAEESTKAGLDLFLSEFLAAAKRSPDGLATELTSLFSEACGATKERTQARESGPQVPVLEPLFDVKTK